MSAFRIHTSFLSAILWASLLFCSTASAHAQANQWLLLRDQDPVSQVPLSSTVRVETMGPWVRTEVELTFRGGEGVTEFLWKAGSGQRLSGWGLDGRTAHAVLKAKEPFHEVEHRPIGITQALHPGALCIPIPEGKAGFRVRWSWEEYLPLEDKGYKYSIGTQYLNADTLSLFIQCNVQTFAPEIKFPGWPIPLAFRKTANRHSLSTKAFAIPVSNPLRIFIPATSDAWQVHTEETEEECFFVIQGASDMPPRARQAAKSMTLLWDASYSGLSRDHTREIATLQRAFQTWENVIVELIPFDIQPRQKQVFKIRQGDITELKAALLALEYDGAGNLAALPWSNFKTDLVVLVGDGESNWGAAPKLSLKKPLIVMHASAPALIPELASACARTGGSMVGRIEDDSIAALGMLMEEYRAIRLQGSAQMADLVSVTPGDPSEPILFFGSRTGKSNQVKLSLGYGNSVEEKVKVTIPTYNKVQQSPGVVHRWAQAMQEKGRHGDAASMQDFCLQHDLESPWTQWALVDDTTAYLTQRAFPRFAKKTSDSLALIRKQMLRFEDTLSQRALSERMSSLADGWQERRLWWENSDAGERAKGKELPDSSYRFEGWVRSTRDQLPISNARLIPGNSKDTTHTDRTGRFQLNFPMPAPQVRVQARGFVDAQVQFQSGQFHRIGLSPLLPSTRIAAALRKAELPLLLPALVPDKPGAYLIDGKLGKAIPDSMRKQIRSAALLGGTWAKLQLGPEAAAGVISLVTQEGHRQGWKTNSRLIPVPWDSLRRYQRDFEQAGPENLERAYLNARDTYGHMPAFYLDAAKWMYAHGEPSLAIRILSNLREIACDLGPLDRTAAKLLLANGETAAALDLFRRAIPLSPEEPQALRDLAFALEQAGQAEEAVQWLTKLVQADWSEVSDLFRGIEIVALHDLLGMLARHRLPRPAGLPAEILALPVDIRITAEWNRMDADVDLWVVQPDGERCDGNQPETSNGGYHPLDFADGYGPEEFLLRKASTGTYRIGLDYYAEDRPNTTGACEVLVTVYTNFGGGQERKQVHKMEFVGQKGSLELPALQWPSGNNN